MRRRGLEADECYKELIANYKDYPKPYFLYGDYLKDRGNIKDALSMYEETYKRDSEYPEVNNRLMHIYLDRYNSKKIKDSQNYKKAVEYATKQIEVDSDPYYYRERGLSCIQRKYGWKHLLTMAII